MSGQQGSVIDHALVSNLEVKGELTAEMGTVDICMAPAHLLSKEDKDVRAQAFAKWQGTVSSAVTAMLTLDVTDPCPIRIHLLPLA